ncbi:MAG: DinB family protein [Candidatus Eisenbacteria bacterium]|nr:DinB family protein [Candidatus Eisenbacteria bacterium]
MFRKLEDFVGGYGRLAESTGRLMGALTDENLSQPVADGHRTLGHVAWHVVTSVPEMMNRVGLGIASVNPESPPPSTAAEIRDAHEAVNAELIEKIRDAWTDETLERVDEMYGETWPRGLTLTILINHQIHHLGQMTVLLRQAGAEVPGIFGPSKEEWARYGMEAPPY